ncbi:MAG: hypothetical protein LM589_05585, partial [Thermosphaera sp.]|nr:hypothetical protein [Thermosphaera sp.]
MFDQLTYIWLGFINLRGVCFLIQCRELLDSTLAIERLSLDPVEVFSTLLALLSEGIGRVALSKKLGFPERTVRKVVTLVKTGEL